MKYLIRAKIEIDGTVDKNDVIGALFGQTEGLLSPDLDLRELQDKGRIGRIVVDLKPVNGKVRGEIKIPSNLDKAETALIAALLETVDKVGPYNARLQIIKIIDLRIEKLKKAVERAKELLKTWQSTEMPDIKDLLKEVQSSLKPAEIIEYGPEKLPAGRDVETSDTLIIVEGRADVLNLLRYGYNNAIAIEGAKGTIPETVKELANKKQKVIAFTDGDHAGELILRTLLSSVKVDLVARAPEGKEVEDLTGREIEAALQSAIPVEQYLEEIAKKPQEAKPEVLVQEKVEAVPKPPVEVKIDLPEKVIKEMSELKGTLEAIIYDNEWNQVARVPVRDLYDTIMKLESGKAKAVVFDGIITQRIIDAVQQKNINIVIGARIGNISKRGEGIVLLSMYDILS